MTDLDDKENDSRFHNVSSVLSPLASSKTLLPSCVETDVVPYSPTLYLGTFQGVPTIDLGTVAAGEACHACLRVVNPGAQALQVIFEKIPAGQGLSVSWDDDHVGDNEESTMAAPGAEVMGFELAALGERFVTIAWHSPAAEHTFAMRYTLTLTDGVSFAATFFYNHQIDSCFIAFSC